MESDLKKIGSTKVTQPPTEIRQARLHSKSNQVDDSFVVTKASSFHTTASLSKRSDAPSTKRSNQEPLLQPQQSRSDDPVSDEAVINIEPENSTQSASTTQNKQADADHDNPNDIKERYTKYSQKALGFAVSTFTTYAISATSTCDAIFIAAAAAFFVAISADLFSWKMKPKQGDALVCLSSFSLVLMTFFIFLSLNKEYGYTILVLPLIIGAALIHYMLMPEEKKESSESTKDAKADTNLEEIFDFSALILNWGGLISAIIAILRRFISGPDKIKLVAVCAIGFLFFFAIILGIYLMLATTIRTVTLTLHARYLYVLLRVVLLSTLIVTLITFVRA
ncbi:unnamed protein product [Urochloa humidicola]